MGKELIFTSVMLLSSLYYKSILIGYIRYEWRPKTKEFKLCILRFSGITQLADIGRLAYEWDWAIIMKCKYETWKHGSMTKLTYKNN